MLGTEASMIELSEEQIQALASQEEFPPRVINPRTNETFVSSQLAKAYELLKDPDYDASPWTGEELEALASEIAEGTDWAEFDDSERR